jgi:hypothetical protein
MDKKSLTTKVNDSANPIVEQNLSVELVEMSEQDLKQIIGGDERSFAQKVRACVSLGHSIQFCVRSTMAGYEDL